METITIEPNKTFAWRKGLRLIPNEKATIEFPGGLILESERIGEIIEVSDDAEIAFQQNSEKAYERIILRVPQGNAVCIHRSTQAMLAGNSSITFQVEF